MRKIIFFVLVLIAASCGSEVNQQSEPEFFIHNNDIIGWKIQIPADWDIVKTQNNTDSLTSLIDSMIEEPDGVNDYLFSFQKDEYNMLQSSVEPFTEEYEEEWLDNFRAVKQLLCDIYLEEQIKMDTSKTVTVDMLGREFLSYEVRLYDDNDKIKLNQIFYSTLINEHDFTVCLNYNSEVYKQELLEIWRNSHLN